MKTISNKNHQLLLSLLAAYATHATLATAATLGECKGYDSRCASALTHDACIALDIDACYWDSLDTSCDCVESGGHDSRCAGSTRAECQYWISLSAPCALSCSHEPGSIKHADSIETDTKRLNIPLDFPGDSIVINGPPTFNSDEPAVSRIHYRGFDDMRAFMSKPGRSKLVKAVKACPVGYTYSSANPSDENDGTSGHENYNIASISQCASLCEALSGCDAFEYNSRASRCTLKTASNYSLSGKQASGWTTCLSQASDATCPAGYQGIPNDLDGEGKEWAPPHPSPSRTARDCASICDAREGCTSFEYAKGASETGACGTYTGGDSNVFSDENRLDAGSNWISCVKATTTQACTYTIYWSGYSGDQAGTIEYVGPDGIAWDSFDTCVDQTTAAGTIAENQADSCSNYYGLALRVLRRTDNNEIIGIGNCCNTINTVTSSHKTCQAGGIVTKALSTTLEVDNIDWFKVGQAVLIDRGDRREKIQIAALERPRFDQTVFPVVRSVTSGWIIKLNSSLEKDHDAGAPIWPDDWTHEARESFSYVVFENGTKCGSCRLGCTDCLEYSYYASTVKVRDVPTEVAIPWMGPNPFVFASSRSGTRNQNYATVRVESMFTPFYPTNWKKFNISVQTYKADPEPIEHELVDFVVVKSGCSEDQCSCEGFKHDRTLMDTVMCIKNAGNNWIASKSKNYSFETGIYWSRHTAPHTQESGIVYQWNKVKFHTRFKSPPVVLANVQTDLSSKSGDKDPYNIRLRNICTESFEFIIDEDTDRAHVSEWVAYYVIGEPEFPNACWLEAEKAFNMNPTYVPHNAPFAPPTCTRYRELLQGDYSDLLNSVCNNVGVGDYEKLCLADGCGNDCTARRLLVDRQAEDTVYPELRVNSPSGKAVLV